MAGKLSPYDIVCAARMSVYRRLPYFMKMLFRLEPVPHPGAGTFFVDEKLRVHFDPVLAVEWGPEHCATFLAHEVQHPMREHMKRGNVFITNESARWHALQPWLAKIHPLLGRSVAFFWNVVADLEINVSVIEAGFVFPPKFHPVFPKTFALENGKFAEEYANELFRRAEHRQRVDRDADKARINPNPFNTPQSNDGDEESDDEGESAQQHENGGDGDGNAHVDGDASGNASDAANGSPAAEDAASSGSAADSSDESEPPPAPFEGMCGGCAGHKHELEDDIDEADMPKGQSESEVDIARRQVAHDTKEPTKEMEELMKQYGKGSVPGDFKRWAEAQLAPAEVPWQKVLAPLVRNAIAYVRGRIERTYSKPSRHRSLLHQLYGDNAPILPGQHAPLPQVVLVVDTSGSMNSKTANDRTYLDEALSEVVGVVLATGVPYWAAAVDAKVQAWVQVKSKKDASALITGGGGTDMRVGIKAAEERKADVIVLVTDGYTDWPSLKEMPRRARLVTCIIGNATAPAHMKPLVRCNNPKKGGH